MANLKFARGKGTPLLSVAAIVLWAMPAMAQSAKDNCHPASVIPLATSEPPAKIVIDPPLPEPLARGVAVIHYCTENLHIAPVFGPNALAVSPRVGHVHVRVDDATTMPHGCGQTPVVYPSFCRVLHPVHTKWSLS